MCVCIVLRCINQLNIYITCGYKYTKTATQAVFSFDGSAMSTRQGGRTTVVFRAEAVLLRATGVSIGRLYRSANLKFWKLLHETHAAWVCRWVKPRIYNSYARFAAFTFVLFSQYSQDACGFVFACMVRRKLAIPCHVQEDYALLCISMLCERYWEKCL